MELDLHLLVIDHAADHLTGLCQLVGLDAEVGHHAVERGGQRPASQLVLGGGKSCARRRKLTLRQGVTGLHVSVVSHLFGHGGGLVGIIALRDNHILHFQIGLFHLQLRLLDGLFLLFNGITQFENV